jgi:LmbE family N-acetylglucosaminyl deacetylase
MKLGMPNAELVVPDGTTAHDALARTTHLAIGAHHDDLEILAIHGILGCLDSADSWFTGVVVSDGCGSPRSGPYADFADQEMAAERRREQCAAARAGRYGAQVLLAYPSAEIKSDASGAVTGDLFEILSVTRPHTLYTHNLADKHDTHVAVAMRVIEAARKLPKESAPKRLLGCEVWRDLDWLVDEDKVVLDLSAEEALQRALLEVFASQIAGGKRYDLGALGRRRAHATFLQSHATDQASLLGFAMDLTPLLENPRLNPGLFVAGCIERFAEDVRTRIERFAR